MTVYKLTLLLLLTSHSLSACGLGPQGDDGLPGIGGRVGDAGIPGTNGTVITPIKLCSSCTPRYPTTFPEYALCLQNTLYGVYSANGGFMALLPPGNYSSNGVGCSCTFAVSDNCRVTER